MKLWATHEEYDQPICLTGGDGDRQENGVCECTVKDNGTEYSIAEAVTTAPSLRLAPFWSLSMNNKCRERQPFRTT